jgi:predicted ATPase
MTLTAKLNRVRVAGFRSLRDVALDLTPTTVLIGPNGAGKSNLLWALEMARFIAFESLQLFVGERGGASYLMHYGPRKTPAIDLELEFSSETGENAYHARLGYGSNEGLIFLWEKAGFRRSAEQAWRWSDLGAGHQESKLRDASGTDTTAKTVRWLLRQVNFYHFHDTSRRSPLRTRDFADTGSDYLRSDGSNLASFLNGLRQGSAEEDQASWRRILYHVTSAAPFIKDLTPLRDRHGVALQWVDDTGVVLGPAHLSDGTLRAIALFAALEQPRSTLPIVSCFDEPELGLHPAALELLASAVRSVASDRQVLISTQSTALLDLFEPGQVVVAERHAGATTLRRLVEADLADWLSEYRLSEIYDSNLIGGRP